MLQLNCPSCGGEVPLRAAAVPYAVCPYCQTLIMRDGDDLRAIGKTAVLPFDVSPIQLGTTIESDSMRFEAVGRVRWGWTDGSWNEWLLQGTDGSARWLGEAMGSFMVLKEMPAILDAPLVRQFSATGTFANGAILAAAGRNFQATDVKQVKCLGGEGELPFPTPPDWTMTSIDFRADDGAALSLQRDDHGTDAWFGHYFELGDLKPANLRVIDGWAIPGSLL